MGRQKVYMARLMKKQQIKASDLQALTETGASYREGGYIQCDSFAQREKVMDVLCKRGVLTDLAEPEDFEKRPLTREERLMLSLWYSKEKKHCKV